MTHDAIFKALPREVLPEIARYVGFSPLISEKPFKTLRDLPHLEQAGWLDSRRSQLEDELCSVGSWTFGSTKPYREIVVDLANKVGASYAAGSGTPAVELAILTKVWNDAVKKMTPEQLEELKAQAEAFAKEHGSGFSKEFAGFATLTAAQMSGFGIYLLGSTLLGAINSALGLGLSFGAFTGLSSLISTVIGPFGWAALGLATIIKLGAPNYKKILPAIILIAASRPLIAGDLPGACGPLHRPDDSAAAVAEAVARPQGPEESSSVPVSPEPTPLPSADVQKQQRAVEKFTRAAESRAKVKQPETHKITKAERTVFALKHPDLSRVAAEFGLDYLVLSPEDQNAVREMVKERQEFEEMQAADAKREARRERKRLERASGAKREQRNGKQIEAKRKEYKHLLRALDFTDIALERLCALSDEDRVPLWSELGLLNDGVLDGKHHVPGTKPTIFQRDAGRGGRIYFRRQSGTKTALIELIGNKKCEDADYRLMRNGSC